MSFRSRITVGFLMSFCIYMYFVSRLLHRNRVFRNAHPHKLLISFSFLAFLLLNLLVNSSVILVEYLPLITLYFSKLKIRQARIDKPFEITYHDWFLIKKYMFQNHSCLSLLKPSKIRY